MVARNTPPCQTTQRCRSADHRRLLGVVISLLIIQLKNYGLQYRITQISKLQRA